MWNSLEDTRGALMGTYGLVRSAMADHNAHWLLGDVRAGEFKSPIRQDLKAIIANDLNASYESLEAISNWRRWFRSEEHTSELQSLMRISYAVFCLKKKKQK